MPPTIPRNSLSAKRPGCFPPARAVGPRPTDESAEPPGEGESLCDQLLAKPDLPMRPSASKLPLRPSATNFDATALRPRPAPPAPPVTRRKAEPPPPPENALMLPVEVAAILRISVKALEHLRRRGTDPAHICLGGHGRGVRYRREAVERYVAELAEKNERRT